MRKYVSYLRVSTDKQGRSGLGLEAQRAAVTTFLNGSELVAEYVEVESGQKNDRPQLQKALKHCEIVGATLIIAKLDRLSRDAHFLLGLQKQGTKFVAADMPEANEMVVGIMGLMAQHERKLISERTKAALAAAKARGIRLGCPNGAKHLRQLGNSAAIQAVKERADDYAELLRDTVQEICSAGQISLSRMADELNRRSVRTARGGKWHPATAGRLVRRLQV
jgi:DNA invertase Pin-like site-specific DNA recombinase